MSDRESWKSRAKAAAGVAGAKERVQRNGHAPAPDDKPASPPPETFTAAELMAMQIPQPRWAVDSILPEGLSIFAGKPKLGKSWLAYHVALAVAAGGVALGRIPVEAGSVLYLALEDSKGRLRRRMVRLLGPDEPAPPRLHLAREWPRLDRGGGDAIAEWIETHADARLVFIDTWAKLRPVRLGKSDAYEIDYADGAQVKALADKYGVAIVVIHHCRKMGATDPLEEVAGSVGLTGACDGILVMRRERGQLDATLCVTGRDVDESELALCFTKENCLWQLLGDAEKFRLSRERQEVIAALRQSGRPLKPGDLAPILGKTLNSIKQLLWKMSNDGQLLSLGSGLYAVDNRDNRGDGDNSRNHDNRAVTGSPESDNRDNAMETPWG